jgi:hypothetical protein
VRTWELTVHAEPEYAGKVGNSGRFDEGSAVPIAAEPIEGYAFAGWSGAPVENALEPQTRVQINSDLSVTAAFERVSRFVVRANNPYAGTVSGTGDHAPGSTVPIRAEPGEGFEFAHWESPLVHDPSAPETFVNVPNVEHDVIAVFVPQEQDLSESDEDSEDSSKTGDDAHSQQDDAESSEQDQQKPQDEDQDDQSEGTPEQQAQESDETQQQAVQLSPEEARQLLEAMRRQEKLLPMGEHAVPESERARERRGRDW